MYFWAFVCPLIMQICLTPFGFYTIPDYNTKWVFIVCLIKSGSKCSQILLMYFMPSLPNNGFFMEFQHVYKIPAVCIQQSLHSTSYCDMPFYLLCAQVIFFCHIGSVSQFFFHYLLLCTFTCYINPVFSIALQICGISPYISSKIQKCHLWLFPLICLLITS